MFFLANKLLVLPVELIPNNDGMFQSIGLDDIVGAMVLAVCFMRIRENDNDANEYRSIMNIPERNVAWFRGDRKDFPNAIKARRLLVTTATLLVAYFFSGIVAPDVHNFLQWAEGVHILGIGLRPFFNKQKSNWIKLYWGKQWVWWVVGGYYVSTFLANIANTVNYFILPRAALGTGNLVWQLLNPEVIVKIFLPAQRLISHLPCNI
eukprot:431879_1